MVVHTLSIYTGQLSTLPPTYAGWCSLGRLRARQCIDFRAPSGVSLKTHDVARGIVDPGLYGFAVRGALLFALPGSTAIPGGGGIDTLCQTQNERLYWKLSPARVLSVTQNTGVCMLLFMMFCQNRVESMVSKEKKQHSPSHSSFQKS